MGNPMEKVVEVQEMQNRTENQNETKYDNQQMENTIRNIARIQEIE